MAKIKWLIINAGTLINYGDFVKFSVNAPKHCKRLLGAFPYSRELYCYQEDVTGVNLSLSVNNRAVTLLSQPFSLGHNDDDNSQSRMVRLDEPLISGQKISGFVENISELEAGTPFNVSIYLKCELEQ